MKIYRIIFVLGLLVAVPGQFIFAFIFWENDLFIHHWTIGLIGWLLMMGTVPWITKDIVRAMMNEYHNDDVDSNRIENMSYNEFIKNKKTK